LEAQDGREALEQVEHSAIDLVITDLSMPGQEGLETIQILRQNWPELKIIAMTGKSAGSMLHAAEVLGEDAALAKPMRIHELLNTIQHLIGT
jgi:CheY-like chemotaxis protein